MADLNQTQIRALEWLSMDRQWRSSAFSAATMNALVRRDLAQKRYCPNGASEYRGTAAGRAALQEAGR